MTGRDWVLGAASSIISESRSYFGPDFPDYDSEVFFRKGLLLGAQIDGPGIISTLLVHRNFRHLVDVNVLG